jgi:hypothetical protein
LQNRGVIVEGDSFNRQVHQRVVREEHPRTTPLFKSSFGVQRVHGHANGVRTSTEVGRRLVQLADTKELLQEEQEVKEYRTN